MRSKNKLILEKNDSYAISISQADANGVLRLDAEIHASNDRGELSFYYYNRDSKYYERCISLTKDNIANIQSIITSGDFLNLDSNKELTKVVGEISFITLDGSTYCLEYIDHSIGYRKIVRNQYGEKSFCDVYNYIVENSLNALNAKLYKSFCCEQYDS